MQKMTEVLAIGDEWEEITTGKKFFAIQTISQGMIEVMLVGETDTDPVQGDQGIRVGRGVLGLAETGFSVGGLPDNTAIWARSYAGVETAIAIAY